MKRVPMAMQLHLELDLGYFADEHKEVLRRYGRMKDGITRDFIVPGNRSTCAWVSALCNHESFWMGKTATFIAMFHMRMNSKK